ncbi:VPLPA-CTERM sorting domain-containing protein [Tropicibacter sp. S64]|uniref:VPLPA-CTERM sorting domain-containing protein n=1 Tax=Tropicibacter sp. S64 TaxID=3415122 RepID=UPI003C7E394C
MPMSLSRLFGLSALIMTCALPLDAAVLAPGGTVFPTGITSLADPELAGGVVQEELLPFQAQSPTPAFLDVLGNVQNRAIASNLTGNIILAYQLRELSSTYQPSGIQITGMSLSGFASYGLFSLDVDYRTDSTGNRGLTSVSRSGDGNVLTFAFDPIAVSGLFGVPSDSSYLLSLKTDASTWSNTGILTVFGFDTVEGRSFSTTFGGLAVPGAAEVPIPAGGALLIGALMVLGIVRRRR